MSDQHETTRMLVCPLCKGALVPSADCFACPTCRRDYPLVNGIPDFYIPPPLEQTANDPVWQENLVWLDSDMIEARDSIYRLSARELKGMAYAMQRLACASFPGCRILEVGTGTGHFAAWIAEVCAPGTEIYAFDFAPLILKKARANTEMHPAVTLLRANGTGPLPFRLESFDFILLRLAPFGEHGIDNVLASYQYLKPGGWLFKAGWAPRPNARNDFAGTAIQIGFESAETHEWLYPRQRSREEYDASLVERERAIAFGAPADMLPIQPWQDGGSVVMTHETLRIARKPA